MKFLVHFHLYYHDQLDWFLAMMANLTGFDFDMIVTYVERNNRSMAMLRVFKEDVRFMQVPNQGYDIWPFILAVRSVDLSKYTCVLKLHTKSPQNTLIHLRGARLKGFDWRNEMVENLIGSTEAVLDNLKAFRDDPKTGLVCPFRYYIKGRLVEDRIPLHYELGCLGFNTAERRFCAGTMFFVRAEALAFLDSGHITSDMFESDMLSHSGGSTAHVYERVLSIAVTAQGYKVRLAGAGRFRITLRNLWLKAEDVLKLVFSLERQGASKAKYLTVMGFCYRLDDGPGTPRHTRRVRPVRKPED